MQRSHVPLYVIFSIIIIMNIVFWSQTNTIRAAWGNVPPVPPELQASASSLGDNQLSYRRAAIMLTNLGSTGGDVQRFDDYNYNDLKSWFDLSNALDERSRAVPYLAAYYYASANDPEKLRAIIPYIEKVGMAPYPNRWSYLAHAVFLAKHEIGDLDLALDLAEKLAALPDKDAPPWTKQMRAFVLLDQGNKEAAYDVLRQIMVTGVDSLPSQEIYNMRIILCERVLNPQEAKQDPICQDR